MSTGTVYVVFLRSDNGTLEPVRFALTVDETTTIFHMKQALKLQIKMSTWRINLAYNNIVLADAGQRLFDTGVPLNSHLLMTLDTDEANPRKVIDELISVIDVCPPYF
ncbi:hypothetical protein H4R19_004535 [Coemansia spiralis]|nr:hypothetical protein H4R19_004535 [Coemansia spiralis]